MLLHQNCRCRALYLRWRACVGGHVTVPRLRKRGTVGGRQPVRAWAPDGDASEAVGQCGAPPAPGVATPNSRRGRRGGEPAYKDGAHAEDNPGDGVVGIDVSKDRLDGHARPSGATRCVAHDAAGLKTLLRWLLALAPALVVVEATGGLERRLVHALGAAGLAVAVVNPRQARRLAPVLGRPFGPTRGASGSGPSRAPSPAPSWSVWPPSSPGAGS